jgi:hypothetical protein
MTLEALKPERGEGCGVIRGVLFSIVLHPIAWIVVGIIGTAIQRQEGSLLVLPFIALVGLTQWLYLGPAIWWLRRRGSTAAAKGVLINDRRH